MATLLVQTKFTIPPLRSDSVSRPRLTNRLDAGLQGKLTLISAQAGAGKTTLAVEWLSRFKGRVAWLSLDENDNDPSRIMAYVIAALQAVSVELGQAAHALLDSMRPPPLESMLTSLINDLMREPAPILLVMDDYHVLHERAIHAAMAFFLERLPAQAHLVIITREDPLLPLHQLRARGQLAEIRGSDLRFTDKETATFLNQTMGLALSSEETNLLVRRTEGWVAGLQLAALSLRGQTDADEFIRRFAGDDRYLVDYLMAEVLERQTPEVRKFLLKTALLNHLSASLCNAVTGKTNGRTILNHLEKANLFLVALDNRREWYRYHRLFADLLSFQVRETFEPAQRHLLHQRAGDWYAQHGEIDEAVHHYLAAEQFEAAAELIESVGIQWIVRGQLRRVLDWLARFPRAILRARPLLSVCKAWALDVSGQPAEVEPSLADAEGALSHAPVARQREVRGLVSTIRAYQARRHNDVALSMQYLRQALADLPKDNFVIRSAVNLNLGFNYTLTGELEWADQALAAAVVESQKARAAYVTLIAMAVRGYGFIAQGRLSAAKQLCQEAIDYGLQTNGGQPFPPTGYAYAGMGQVLYEQNDLAGAEEHLRQAVVCGEMMSDWSMTRRGLVSLAWLKQMQGDGGEARSLWQRGLSVVEQAEDDRVRAEMLVHRARIHLASVQQSGIRTVEGAANLAAAAEWAETYRKTQPDPQRYPEALAQLTLAWLEVAQNQASDAYARLVLIASVAEAHGQIDNLIKALALLAVAQFTSGSAPHALATIRRAVMLGYPNGYVRTFIDLGPPMHRILLDATASEVAPDVIARLLSAFPDGGDEADHPSLLRAKMQPPVEPLNEREHQILRRMAARLSNQQIADELHFSVNTVKWHARNLYGKLGVANRVQVVDRARELGIL